jgi:hypothetical protein
MSQTLPLGVVDQRAHLHTSDCIQLDTIYCKNNNRPQVATHPLNKNEVSGILSVMVRGDCRRLKRHADVHRGQSSKIFEQYEDRSPSNLGVLELISK